MVQSKHETNPPLLDAHSTKTMNLNVLRRKDPHVEEILITATHVTLYELDTHNHSWQRKDVEGSMFVVKRTEQPRFQFLVMNRRSTENLVEDLLGDFIFETQVPYILYKNEKEVNGIWFYDVHECEQVSKLFTRILNAFSKAPHEHKEPKITSSLNDFRELEGSLNEDSLNTPLETPLFSHQIETAQSEPEPPFFANANGVYNNTQPDSYSNFQTQNQTQFDSGRNLFFDQLVDSVSQKTTVKSNPYQESDKIRLDGSGKYVSEIESDLHTRQHNEFSFESSRKNPTYYLDRKVDFLTPNDDADGDEAEDDVNFYDKVNTSDSTKGKNKHLIPAVENLFFDDRKSFLPPEKSASEGKVFLALEEIESENRANPTHLGTNKVERPSPLDIFFKPLVFPSSAPSPPPPHSISSLLPPLPTTSSALSPASASPSPPPPFAFLQPSSTPDSSPSDFFPQSQSSPSSHFLPYSLSSPLLSFSAPTLNPSQHSSFPSILSNASLSQSSIEAPSLAPSYSSLSITPSTTASTLPPLPFSSPSVSPSPSTLLFLPQPSHGSALLQPFPPSSLPSFPLQEDDSNMSKFNLSSLPSPSLPPFSSSSSPMTSSDSLVTPLSLMSKLVPQSNTTLSLSVPPLPPPPAPSMVKREDVRRALLKLLMDDRFIDAFCEELNSSMSS